MMVLLGALLRQTFSGWANISLIIQIVRVEEANLFEQSSVLLFLPEKLQLCKQKVFC